MARLIKCDRCGITVDPASLRIVTFLHEMKQNGSTSTSRELCDNCFRMAQHFIDDHVEVRHG